MYYKISTTFLPQLTWYHKFDLIIKRGFELFVVATVVVLIVLNLLLFVCLEVHVL